MIKSHESSIKSIFSSLRISGMVLSNQSDLPAFFSPRKVNLKIGLIPEMTFREWPNPRRWFTKNCKIPGNDLPRLAESQLTTSRNLKWGFDETSSVSHLPIPACCKPELIGIFKLTFRGLKNSGKSLWLDKAIPEFLQPHLLILCSSREIVSLHF